MNIYRNWHLLVALCLLSTDATAANKISGRVLDAGGQPLADATVMVNTAAPRKGISVFCPSCYLDCGRKAVTDGDGRFAIDNVDESLTFNLVATAEGHLARYSGKVDPSKDTPDIQLESLPSDLPPDRVLRGRVVDAAGKPVVGAEVSPIGCRTASRRWWGSLPGVDALSITNDRGEFIITAKDAAEAFDLEIRSPRHAPKRFALVATGGQVHDLAVDVGAIVHGRLLEDGKPIAGVSVGLVQTGRGAENFLGEQQIGTNDKGEFTLNGVPTENDFYLYTIMQSMNGAGSLPLRRVTIDKGQLLTDLADLEIAAAHSLSGRIVLADGAAISGPIQLLLSRDGAWDSQKTMVEADGKFRFDNVPENEPITFTARVPGYRLTQEKNRFQLVRDNSLAMYVEASRDDIDIVFVPDETAKQRP